eukprot:5062176-Pyramimonas_sp.AAC.1
MLFSAASRPAPAPPARDATRAATEATASGYILTGKPLWGAIVESALHRSTINDEDEHVV